MSKKRTVEWEDIAKFLEEGWGYRKKNVDGRDYITLRKGRKERSLGPFNNILWNRIEKLWKLQQMKTKEEQKHDKARKKSVSKSQRKAVTTVKQKKFIVDMERLNRSTQLMEKLKEEISLSRTLTKVRECVFKEEGFCMRWSTDSPIYFDTVQELHGARAHDMLKEVEVDSWKGKKKEWVFSVCPLCCETCSVYLGEKDIEYFLSKIIIPYCDPDWESLLKKKLSQFQTPGNQE